MAFEDRIRLPALSLIHRRLRLLNLLNEFIAAGQRLITVYAPSGYGKSILLADFAQTTDLPVCWCSLEAGDRDPVAFLTLLARSVTDRFHEIDPELLFRPIERGDTEGSIRVMAELLGQVGRHIIILDDYHKANSAGMTLALSRLLDQLPETSQLIVAARGDMALETRQVIDLLVAGRATGLSEVELRFTPEELQLLMRKRFGRQIDLKRAEEIARVTDGNIAQILLTGHIMHAERLIGNLRQQLGDDQATIYNYLAEEVLNKQPADMQHFMLCTSVLPDMTPELCNELLGITDAQQRIEQLVRDDLFVNQIGASFRYHDLFAEFLRTRLADDLEHRREISIKAASLLAARGRYEEAINLYLWAQAHAEACALIEEQAKHFYDTGRALTLHDWLARFTNEELDRHPRLWYWRALILNDDLGAPQQAITFAQRAEKQFLARGDLSGAAQATVLQAVGLRMMGRVTDSLALVNQALERLEPLRTESRHIAYAIRNRGLALATSGDLARALDDLRRALQMYQELHDDYRTGMCHHDIGVCLCQLGNITRAERHFRRAIRIWESLGNANDLANTLNSLGVSLCSVGRYDEALKHFQDCLDVALRVGATRRAAYAQSGIGDVLLARREYERAALSYQESSDRASQAGIEALLVYNLAKLGESLYGQGELGEALKLASRARQMAAELGLVFERGVACALQARILARQAAYADSYPLFREAAECFARSDVLEQAKVHLWWGQSLLADLRPAAALAQLQEAIRLALDMGETIAGLRAAIAETRQLLVHALHRADIANGLRNSVQLLLIQAAEEPEMARPSLQVFTFGNPTLVVAGERRQFSQRGRVRRMPEFLAYLLIKGQEGGCRWSEVSAAIWPDLDPEKASISFHQTIKRLRDSTFGTYDYIVVQDDYYQVNPDYLEWCDALAFEQLFARAARLPSDQAVDLLLELIALYQGEFLAGFELGSWGEAYRAACEAKFLQSVKLASEYLLNQGAPQQALALIEKGLAQDYFREDIHQSAFRAYAQLGLYSQLTEHYNTMCETFRRELGSLPDPATRQLYQQLVARRAPLRNESASAQRKQK